MLIERHEILDPEGAKPIISGVIALGNLVYVKGVTADLAGDITDQTRQVLRQIDHLLAVAGTDKSKPGCSRLVSWLKSWSPQPGRRVRAAF